MEFNYLAILISAVSTFIIGGLWYTVLFGKTWQKLVGLTDNQLTKGMIKVFGGSFILALLMSFNLAAFIGPEADWQFGLFAGFAAGFGWVALALGVNYLFERKPFMLFLINGGYNIVTFSIMGFILGAF